jgi:hypothetical protein
MQVVKGRQDRYLSLQITTYEIHWFGSSESHHRYHLLGVNILPTIDQTRCATAGKRFDARRGQTALCLILKDYFDSIIS